MLGQSNLSGYFTWCSVLSWCSTTEACYHDWTLALYWLVKSTGQYHQLSLFHKWYFFTRCQIPPFIIWLNVSQVITVGSCRPVSSLSSLICRPTWTMAWCQWWWWGWWWWWWWRRPPQQVWASLVRRGESGRGRCNSCQHTWDHHHSRCDNKSCAVMLCTHMHCSHMGPHFRSKVPIACVSSYFYSPSLVMFPIQMIKIIMIIILHPDCSSTASRARESENYPWTVGEQHLCILRMMIILMWYDNRDK